MSNIKKKYKYLDREEINKIARQLIKDIGIKINIQGFKFWCTAITMEFDNEETEKLKMMEVYSKISIKYKTTMSKVERAMRYAYKDIDLRKFFNVSYPVNNTVLLFLLKEELINRIQYSAIYNKK